MLAHERKASVPHQLGPSGPPGPLRQPDFTDRLTTASRRAATAAWALLLLLWGVAAWNAQSGFSSSGPMNLRFAPTLLVAFSILVYVLAPWTARALGTRVHRTAAWAAVLITCWWQFWLPATTIDIGYSIRYGIPDPYIWPGEPGSPVLALSVALWLAAPLADWRGWRLWTCLAIGSVCTAVAVLALDSKAYANTPWQAALGCFVGLVVLLTVRYGAGPERHISRWLMLWTAGMMGLVVFWFVTESAAGWVPRWVNEWFAGWLYS